jgi:bacterioferritin (cytochrome b1)
MSSVESSSPKSTEISERYSVISIRSNDELVALELTIRLAVEVGDNGTREILESILREEEDHIDWLEGQLDQIKQMGIQNYLVEQID